MTVEDVNLSFLLYLVDRRELGDLKRVVESAMNLTFRQEEADVPASELVSSFEAEVLGLYLSLRLAYSWREESIYRFAGSSVLTSTTGTKVSIDSHMARVLGQAGLAGVMSRSEFASFYEEHEAELQR